MTPGRIADVVFDLPLDHAFSYSLPAGVTVARGQRVRSPLAGRARIGMVTDLRDGDVTGLRPVGEPVEPVPILSAAMLELARRAAAESLSSLGSTIANLLPPAPRAGLADTVAPPPEPTSRSTARAALWMDHTREDRLTTEIARAGDSVLVIAPDIEAAGRWARRLDAPRLDSGAPEAARRATWFGAARGRPRVVVGTRSALLAPLPPPATLVLLDEHDPAHKPPGAPRLHSRDLLRARAAVDGSRLLLLSATPSAESWARAESGEWERPDPGRGPWPEWVTADTRGILRNHPLTLPLTRAIEDSARRGRRVALILTRESAALGCDDCGAIFRCPDCGVALALSRAAGALGCRLCGRREPLPEACAACAGHHLSAVGWGIERVEASLRKRFPRLAVARAGARRGAPSLDDAAILIGTPALLRLLPPCTLGCVGFVALDGLLRIPDFRAGERVFQGLWAAGEAVTPDGRVIVQTLHPDHYAIRAARGQARSEFYAEELSFRAELGYPPFRRLCVISTLAPDDAAAQKLIEECRASLQGLRGVTVYPAARRSPPGSRRARWAALVKGPAELPALLAEPLRPLRERRRRSAGMVEVEMDPVSWA